MHAAPRSAMRPVLRPALRAAVVGFSLLSLIGTQTAALAQAHAEGLAAGRAANAAARSQLTAPRAAEVVPGYTTHAPESALSGQASLASPAAARLRACASTPDDPVCQAQTGALSSANTVRQAIPAHDPAVLQARRIAENPAGTLEDIASYYSGCQLGQVATPGSEIRVCRSDARAARHSCSSSLQVRVARRESCPPGAWFAHAGSGSSGLDVQCIPDRSRLQHHFRVTRNGAPQAFFDVDMTSALAFPRRVAALPDSPWEGTGGPNGVWIADNRCVGDACELSALVARDYRTVCTAVGRHGNQRCTQHRPFLENYATCPVGTQSGDNILLWDWSGERQSNASYLDPSTCYAQTASPTRHLGSDVSGTLRGYSYWSARSQRAVLGWRTNSAYGPIPRMKLTYTRPHLSIQETDQWHAHCPDLGLAGEGRARCSVAGPAACVDGPATRTIDGVAVTRDCWAQQTPLSCSADAAGPGSPDECAALQASGCTLLETRCGQQDAATGACAVREARYRCAVPPSTAVSVGNCPSTVFCLAGNCFDTRSAPDADFARTMSLAEAAREAGVYLDTDRLQVFKGEANSCRNRLFTNCCASNAAGAGMNNHSLLGTGSRLVYDVLMNAENREFLYQGLSALLSSGGFSGSFTSYGVTVAVNGTALPAGSAVVYAGESLVIAFDPWSLAIAVVIYAAMSLMSCGEGEAKLSMKEGAGLCHTIGSYCSSCIRLFGFCIACIEHTTGKCCFNSRLARLINEQGRGQFGKGWGSPQGPDCSGFSIAQLQALDFAAMDLRAFYASIVPTLPHLTTLQDSNARRASTCYYGQGKCP